MARRISIQLALISYTRTPLYAAPLSCAMELTLRDAKVVSLNNSPHEIVIKNKDDCVSVDGCEFIRIKPWETAWCKMVLFENPAAPVQKASDGFSLTRSKGYNELIALRNAASCDETPHQNALFDEVDVSAKKTKRFKHVHDDKPTIVSIVVSVNDTEHTIDVLGARHTKDGFFLKYDKETMDVAMQYIRCKGFEEEQKRQNAPAAGVYRPPGQVHYVASAINEATGKKSFRRVTELSEAIEWQAIVRSGADNIDTESPDSATASEAPSSALDDSQSQHMINSVPLTDATEQQRERKVWQIFEKHS